MDKFKAQRADISIVNFKVRKPSAVGAASRFLGLIDVSCFFTTKHAKKARRSQRDFDEVIVPRYLMTKMLKQVQHDVRVTSSGFSDKTIDEPHLIIYTKVFLF